MTKQDSSSGGCVKHAKFVKFNSWSSWPHSGVYLLCLLQQTRVAEKLLKALPAQKAAKWCDVGSANVKKKKSVFKILNKKNSFNIWLNFWFLCALQLTFWTLLKGRITFRIQPSGWTWTMLVFWKRIGANESPHSSTLKRVLAFLCLAITGSQTKPICICKFLELDPPRSLLTEPRNRVNREDTDGPKLHIIQSERPKWIKTVCLLCVHFRRSSCQGMD